MSWTTLHSLLFNSLVLAMQGSFLQVFKLPCFKSFDKQFFLKDFLKYLSCFFLVWIWGLFALCVLLHNAILNCSIYDADVCPTVLVSYWDLLLLFLLYWLSKLTLLGNGFFQKSHSVLCKLNSVVMYLLSKKK